MSEAFAAGEASRAAFQSAIGRVRDEVPAGVGLLGKVDGVDRLTRRLDETGYIGGGVREEKVERESPAKSCRFGAQQSATI